MENVFIVYETDKSWSDDERTPICVCPTFEKAREIARKLNKEKGQDCWFDENWDYYQEETANDKYPHYFSIAKTNWKE